MRRFAACKKIAENDQPFQSFIVSYHLNEENFSFTMNSSLVTNIVIISNSPNLVSNAFSVKLFKSKYSHHWVLQPWIKRPRWF